jgi:hypothetical protein
MSSGLYRKPPNTRRGRFLCVLCLLCVLVPITRALTPEVLVSIRSVPPHIAGQFRDVRAFQRSAFGHYFVFDRRAHTVYALDDRLESSWRIVQIGAEPGRIIGPTAFALAPDGRFAVADAPAGAARVQVFTPTGFRVTGFTLPESAPRVVFNDLVLSGIASMQFTGATILLSQPENGALVTEYSIAAWESRTFGRLRTTGHEHDRDVHLALNSGIALADPRGGFYFIFQAGVPVFHKYDSGGRLLFERRIQGPELDSFIAALPGEWPRRTGELPQVRATVRAAAVDPKGNLWVSFVVPYTYVFDPDGDKIRTVQFRGAGIIEPTSLSFTTEGRLLITPGLYEFDTRSGGP